MLPTPKWPLAGGIKLGPQKAVGVFLTAFAFLVCFNTAVVSEHRHLLFFTVPLTGILLCTAIFENALMKGIQVVLIAATGAISSFMTDGSPYIGMTVLAVAIVHAFTFGFFDTFPRAKAFAIGISLFVLFYASTPNEVKLFSATLRLMMCTAIFGVFFFSVKTLVEKARRLDEIEKHELEQKIATSEALLQETVQAGMVLVNEIKSKDAQDGCKE